MDVRSGRGVVTAPTPEAVAAVVATGAGVPGSCAETRRPAWVPTLWVGSGWVAVGSNVHFDVLGKAFFLPLLFSPLVAIVLGAGLYLLFRWFRLQCGITKNAHNRAANRLRFSPAQPAVLTVGNDLADARTVCADDRQSARPP